MSREIKFKGTKHIVNIGDKFNRLTIVEFTTVQENAGQGRIVNRTACICKCDCGNIVGPLSLRRVVSENDKSCGCLDRENLMKRNTKHGFKPRNYERNKLYDCWVEMHRRCRDTNRKGAVNYALKGIKVCNEWADFLVFREWALNNGYKTGLSIERKDNSKGYSPDNCTWIELKDQCKNRTTNVYIEYNGEVHYLAEWSRITGRNTNRIKRALANGKSVGEALGFE